MKTNEELEQEFIASCKDKTGLSIEEWMVELAPTGLKKLKETTEFIKQEKGLNHMISNWIAGIFLNDGKPVFDQKVLRHKLLNNMPTERLFLELEAGIQKEIPQTSFVATKGYMSFRINREYGCAKITKKEIKLGLDLGETPFEGRLLQAKSLGAMPRLSHMIVLVQTSDIDKEVFAWMKAAVKRIS